MSRAPNWRAPSFNLLDHRNFESPKKVRRAKHDAGHGLEFGNPERLR